MDRELRHDLKTLAEFIEVYCRHRHHDRGRTGVSLKHFDLEELVNRKPELCSDCSRLLTYAFAKRSRCPLQPKPPCKHCPEHCYLPEYRLAIREVMKYSGRRLVLSGRLDYLYHLLF